MTTYSFAANFEYHPDDLMCWNQPLQLPILLAPLFTLQLMLICSILHELCLQVLHFTPA